MGWDEPWPSVVDRTRSPSVQMHRRIRRSSAGYGRHAFFDDAPRGAFPCLEGATQRCTFVEEGRCSLIRQVPVMSSSIGPTPRRYQSGSGPARRDLEIPEPAAEPVGSIDCGVECKELLPADTTPS